MATVQDICDIQDAVNELRIAREHLAECECDPDAELPDFYHARDRVRWAAENLRDIAASIVTNFSF